MATKHYCVHGGDDYLQASLNDVGNTEFTIVEGKQLSSVTLSKEASVELALDILRRYDFTVYRKQ